jgi:hypothetical protein
MPHVEIKFIVQGDACWPDLRAKLEEGKVEVTDAPLQFAYLPGGMKSGKGSISIRFDLADGRTVIGETSAAALIAVAQALAAKEQS